MEAAFVNVMPGTQVRTAHRRCHTAPAHHVRTRGSVQRLPLGSAVPVNLGGQGKPVVQVRCCFVPLCKIRNKCTFFV